MMNIVTIVQMRMGSTRLPGKSMKTILGKPLVGFLMERLKRVQGSQRVVLATTANSTDDVLADYCSSHGWDCFRGSEEDVLDRYYQCALHYNADAIVRICGDCPLIDPDIVDRVIRRYLELSPAIDYVSNTLERTFPRGMDVEVFSFGSFKKIAQMARTPSEREHVTSYYYLHPELFKLDNVPNDTDMSKYRLTVDVEDDFKLIRLILEHLYPKKPDFDLKDIGNIMEKHPEWVKINAHVQQKSL